LHFFDENCFAKLKFTLQNTKCETLLFIVQSYTRLHFIFIY